MAADDKEIDCFLSYAKEDAEVVQKLFLDLKAAGINAWMDKPPHPYTLDGLRPGQDWETTLRRVMAASRFFIPCFSKTSVSKTGFVQSEFRQALVKVSQTPSSEISVIPVRLEPCKVPDHRVDGVSFDQRQWIDCFNEDFKPLIDAIKFELPTTKSVEADISKKN